MASSGFSDAFSNYLSPSAELTESAIKLGMVVLDTNVLLSAYRFAPAARSELLAVIERLGDRVWIPHQVALEFHRNRLQVISDQSAEYESIMGELKKQQEVISKGLNDKLRHLANRAALSAQERDRLISLVESSLGPATDAVEELRRKHGVVDVFGNDPILVRLQEMLSGKVGDPFSPEEEVEARKEAEKRISGEVPPGYKDASKKKYPHGDYFVWKQSLDEAAMRKSEWLTLVTNDNKEDWYRIIKNRAIGARPELVAEARSTANTQLVMFNIDQFLSQAKRHLGASVSTETIRQAASLPTENVEGVWAAQREFAAVAESVINLEKELADVDSEISACEQQRYEIRELLSEAAKDPARSSEILADLDDTAVDRLSERLATST